MTQPRLTWSFQVVVPSILLAAGMAATVEAPCRTRFPFFQLKHSNIGDLLSFYLIPSISNASLFSPLEDT